MSYHHDRMIDAPPVQKKWIVPRAALQFEYEQPVFVTPARRPRRAPVPRGPNWTMLSAVIGGLFGLMAAQAVLYSFPSDWKFNRDPTGLVRVLQGKIDGENVKR